MSSASEPRGRGRGRPSGCERGRVRGNTIKNSSSFETISVQNQPGILTRNQRRQLETNDLATEANNSNRSQYAEITFLLKLLYQQFKKTLVCGDRFKGIHYGVSRCGRCKSFFK
ncbi:hypothetical protein BpHYR1_038119 [Brachionus plicatilis]|uniref:Nuclear receptor domain-containing protein n=1 Tax=Brachionus plicatilis TaxID=10195 RepID=A0A3M7QHK7_BRAPC|nr:hypothetical protein BpHYR1_038119 [Brachionus plicatilis]